MKEPSAPKPGVGEFQTLQCECAMPTTESQAKLSVFSWWNYLGRVLKAWGRKHGEHRSECTSGGSRQGYL